MVETTEYRAEPIDPVTVTQTGLVTRDITLHPISQGWAAANATAPHDLHAGSVSTRMGIFLCFLLPFVLRVLSLHARRRNP